MAIFANYSPIVAQALQARGLSGQCPMCKQNQWMLHDVPVSMPVYEATGAVKFPGTSMPMAAMICRNCGFAGFFTLGSLGLINAPSSESAAASAPQMPDTPAATPIESTPSEPVAQPPEIPAAETKPRRRKRIPKRETPAE